jgi:hypothetical protein
MSRAAAIAAVLAIAACGGDDEITPEPLVGAPAAVRALLPSDPMIVIGGDSAFGLARLLKRTGDTWTPAADVVPFGSQAMLFQGDVPMAASETTLYRLEDTARFTWTAIAIPPASSQVQLIGAVGDAIYGIAPDPDGGAVVRWVRGTAIWQEVTRPIGTGARAFLVEPDSIIWSDPARGVVVAVGDVAGHQETVAHCTTPELGECSTALLPLALSPDAGLALIGCPSDGPPFAAYRAQLGELVEVGLPDDLSPCLGAIGGAGHGVLWTEDAVLDLGPTAKSWKRIAASGPGLRYISAGRAIYGYGDGISARGIYLLDL